MGYHKELMSEALKDEYEEVLGVFDNESDLEKEKEEAEAKAFNNGLERGFEIGYSLALKKNVNMTIKEE